MAGETWQYARAEPTPGKWCIDCKAAGRAATRPAPYPGPRCASCNRLKSKSTSKRAKERRIEATYGLTADQYDALYAKQAGRCAGCRRANGGSKRLAVDHDHTCCPGKTSCGQCVRGLLCDTCNRILGHARDSTAYFERMADYLRSSPTGWRSGYGQHGRV